jgi:hypothetical protein
VKKRVGRTTDLTRALEGIVRRLDRKSGGSFASARVTQAWGEVAGEMVTRHTTGAHLREGALVVYVDNATWATELSAMSEKYRLSINEAVGEDLVSTVSFTVSKRVARAHQLAHQEAEAETFYGADEVESVQLDAVERAQVESSAQVIPDPELREAAIRATVKHLEWKKGIRGRNSSDTPSGAL